MFVRLGAVPVIAVRPGVRPVMDAAPGIAPTIPVNRITPAVTTSPVFPVKLPVRRPPYPSTVSRVIAAMSRYVTVPVSPDTGAVVNAVTARTPAAVDAVMSVACPRKFAVVVFRSNVRIRPLN